MTEISCMEAKRRLMASSIRYLKMMIMTQTTNNLNKIQVIGTFARILKAVVIARIKTWEEEAGVAGATTNTQINRTTTSNQEEVADHYKTQTIPNKKGDLHGATTLISRTWEPNWTITLMVRSKVVNNKKLTNSMVNITKNRILPHLLQTTASDFKITKSDTLATNTTTEASITCTPNQDTAVVSPTTTTMAYTNKMATTLDIKAIIRATKADHNTTNNVGDEGITFVNRFNKLVTIKKTTTIMERKRG